MLGLVAKYLQDASVLRRLLFAAVFLSPELPAFWEVVLEFATKGKLSKYSVTSEQIRALTENLQALNESAFTTDCKLQQELLSLHLPGKKPLGVILISPISSCLLCGCELQLRKDRHAPVVLYDINLGTIPGAHFHKFCTNRTCSLTQYYGYYRTQGKAIFNQDWAALPYFLSSSETGFSLELLRQLDANILIGQMSFKQQADIYNYVHKYSLETAEPSSTCHLDLRQRMDRRRLEDAFFQYALLNVASWYPEHICQKDLHLHEGLSETLTNMTPVFQKAFTEKYAGHRCNAPGCGNVLVLDGNMKNNREVCLAIDAGYAEFSGLPGKVKTGCPNTPQFKSRYCHLHAGLTISVDEAPSEERPGIIISKRVTRSTILYQVVWLGRPTTESSWKSAETLPQSLVDEFEAGVMQDIHRDTSKIGGQTVHTICTKRTQRNEVQPSAKKFKSDTIQHISYPSGSFSLPEEEKTITCNTQKDAHGRLNHRIAGILAGIHPCGTIALFGELFGAESKQQVYGHLHSYFFNNKEIAASISTVCYDDACHLKKFASNPARSSLTTVASQLASVDYAVDRMHFKGHIDPWCREHCDPHKLQTLQKVNSEICEQTFSWMSRYSFITRHMSRWNFLFYLLYLCNLHNNYKKC